MTVTIHTGDCRIVLPTLPEGSARTCVTSPPYFGLRDYGHDTQIGLEPTVEAYVESLVAVFREVRRVLTDDGTLWLNLGDTYGKGKQLTGVPWRVAFALQRDGWILRQDVIWHKPNPMPENVADRPTRAHEYIFLMSKRERYYYDTEGGLEPSVEPDRVRSDRVGGATGHTVRHSPGGIMTGRAMRNRRSVWTINTMPYSGAHFATFPPDLIEPCIKAGSATGDVVLDPFGGSGTTGMVADRLGRDAVLIDANPAYVELARRRITSDAPMFASVQVLS